MAKVLGSCKPGESGVVARVTGEGKIRRRLFDMGVTPGAAFTLRGYELTLRKTEGDCVEIEENGEGQTK